MHDIKNKGKLQDFINENNLLVDEGNWYDLFRKCPTNLRRDLSLLLIEAELDLKDKNSDSYYTLSTPLLRVYGYEYRQGHILTIRKPTNNIFNIGWTNKAYANADDIICFSSMKDATNALINLEEVAPNAYISTRQKAAMDRTTWVSVTTNIGPALITKEAFDRYDPVKKAQRAQARAALKASSK